MVAVYKSAAAAIGQPVSRPWWVPAVGREREDATSPESGLSTQPVAESSSLARRRLSTLARRIVDVELIQHSQGGLGIGRTLVRSRLEKHGGSNPAHGAGTRTAQPVHGLDFAGSGTVRNEPALTAR